LVCRVQKNINENKVFIILSITFLFLFLILNTLKQQWLIEKRDLEDLIGIVLNSIKEYNTIIPENLKDDLILDFDDKINVKKLWTKVENYIKKDYRIKIIIDENDLITWNWNNNLEQNFY
jgi:hypothetical protein